MMSDRQRCRSRYRVLAAAAVIVIPLIIRTNEMRPPPTKRIIHVNRKIIPSRCICTAPRRVEPARESYVIAGLRWSVLWSRRWSCCTGDSHFRHELSYNIVQNRYNIIVTRLSRALLFVPPSAITHVLRININSQNNFWKSYHRVLSSPDIFLWSVLARGSSRFTSTWKKKIHLL